MGYNKRVKPIMIECLVCGTKFEHWHYSFTKTCSKVCAAKLTGEGLRLTIDVVRQYFEEHGYKILSNEYINSCTKLDCVCPEGHKIQISWTKFHAGHRCAECAFSRHRLSIVQVNESFEKEGYKVLSKEYINSKGKIDYECSKGHRNSTSWTGFQQGFRCPDCFGNKKLNIDHVRRFFVKERYQLLSAEYKNSVSKLKFRCPRGHVDSIRWSSFYQGHRCPQCQEWKGEKRLGEILEQMYPGKIKQHDNLVFLERQTVDFSIREFKLAFEFDGQQHFKPICFNGSDLERANKNFLLQQERDIRKSALCEKNGYIMIRVKYIENLTKEFMNKRISEALERKN